MTIDTFTHISASGKRTSKVMISGGKEYRYRGLGMLGHLRFYTDGRIEYVFGKYVNSRAITLRDRRN